MCVCVQVCVCVLPYLRYQSPSRASRVPRGTSVYTIVPRMVTQQRDGPTTRACQTCNLHHRSPLFLLPHIPSAPSPPINHPPAWFLRHPPPLFPYLLLFHFPFSPPIPISPNANSAQNWQHFCCWNIDSYIIDLAFVINVYIIYTIVFFNW